MVALGFTFASFMIIMNREPRFKSVSIDRCRRVMESYPNGLSRQDVDSVFRTNREDMGSIFFKRDSTLFMLDVKEDKVFLNHIESSEYDISTYCGSYSDLKNRVEEIGGEFVDDRFIGLEPIK